MPDSRRAVPAEWLQKMLPQVEVDSTTVFDYNDCVPQARPPRAWCNACRADDHLHCFDIDEEGSFIDADDFPMVLCGCYENDLTMHRRLREIKQDIDWGSVGDIFQEILIECYVDACQSHGSVVSDRISALPDDVGEELFHQIATVVVNEFQRDMSSHDMIVEACEILAEKLGHGRLR